MYMNFGSYHKALLEFLDLDAVRVDFDEGFQFGFDVVGYIASGRRVGRAARS